MGATNHTTNYNLSQFVGTDKPAWLQDYNGDMTKIDAGINAAKLAADSADLAAGAAQSDATAANNAITNTITPAITSLQTAVGSQGGSINTITSLIGNGTPTTTDQTIIGAINEINARDKYNTIPITAASTSSDFSTLIGDSITKGKSPHIVANFIFSSGGNNYTVSNAIFEYSSNYSTDYNFVLMYGGTMMQIAVKASETTFNSIGGNLTAVSFSDATLYH